VNFGLDYEGTFARDTVLWGLLITQMKIRGHRIYLFTLKTTTEAASIPASATSQMTATYATSRRSKEDYARSRGIVIDVWIDNNPKSIYNGAREVTRDMSVSRRGTQPKKLDDY
jgi:hypothetical protein